VQQSALDDHPATWSSFAELCPACDLDRGLALVVTRLLTPEPTGDHWFRTRNSDGVYDVPSDERSAAIQLASAKWGPTDSSPLMQAATGVAPQMWGPSIVGFGSRPHTNPTGTNDWFVVEFSPRQRATTVYGIHDGYGPPDPLLAVLGPHTTSRGCLYIKQLSEIEQGVLTQMVVNAWEGANRPT
jgi:hypothetical protein